MLLTGPMLYGGPAEKAGVATKSADAHRPSTKVAICRGLMRIAPLLPGGDDSAPHGSGRQAGSVAARLSDPPVASGSVKATRAPPPVRFSAQMLPPCAS